MSIASIHEDRNFDGLAEHFKKKIYGSPKGEIRLQLLWEDLSEHLLNDIEKEQSLSVLDVGGGIGQIAAKLAKSGHKVILTDVSTDMLALAAEHFSEQQLCETDYQLKNLSINQLDQLNEHSFDLVVFHAVLEWLAKPESGLKQVMKQVQKGGCISLMFYNKHSVIMKNLLKSLLCYPIYNCHNYQNFPTTHNCSFFLDLLSLHYTIN